MNLCSDGHEEVCYEGRGCPACALGKEKDHEIAKLERENGDHLDTIHDLEGTITTLESELDALKETAA